MRATRRRRTQQSQFATCVAPLQGVPAPQPSFPSTYQANQTITYGVATSARGLHLAVEMLSRLGRAFPGDRTIVERRILIIDDDRSMCEVLDAELETAGL